MLDQSDELDGPTRVPSHMRAPAPRTNAHMRAPRSRAERAHARTPVAQRRRATKVASVTMITVHVVLWHFAALQQAAGCWVVGRSTDSESFMNSVLNSGSEPPIQFMN